jgi:hypothetical protein
VKGGIYMNKRYQQIRRCLEPDLKKIKAMVIKSHKSGITDGEVKFDKINHKLWNILSDIEDTEFDQIKSLLENRIRKELHIKWMLHKEYGEYRWVNPVKFYEFQGQYNGLWDYQIRFNIHYYRW